jgi:Tol biopolymer transport system component
MRPARSLSQPDSASSSPPTEGQSARRVWIGGLFLLAAASTSAQDPAQLAPEVRSSVILIAEGGRFDWSAQGDLLAYDRLGEDQRFDVWVREIPNGADRCLACRTPELRTSHVLSPSWHPSGEWLVVLVQREAKRLALGVEGLLGPDRGLFSDLWLMRADGRATFQLTKAGVIGSAVLDPHFAPEADALVWSARTRSRVGRYGEWQLQVAELHVRRGVPRLGKVRAFLDQQIDGLVVAQDFFPDNRRILIAAQRAMGNAIGLAVFDPESDDVKWLTASRSGSDDHGRVSPRAPLIAYASEPQPAVPGPLAPGTEGGELPAREVFVMDLDGGSKHQLTRFNSAGAVESLGRAWVGDLAWSPDGERLAVQVIYGIAEAHPAIVLLELGATPGPATPGP